MQIGDRVVTDDGERGRIATIDEMTGWFHVHLDKHDGAYRNFHAGPFTKSELEAEG